ncbi:Uncharacterised protein [Mycobacterium tuberculosis]|nr:Uncharacterised protein [Mycobacterium tuberculosis]
MTFEIGQTKRATGLLQIRGHRSRKVAAIEIGQSRLREARKRIRYAWLPEL